MAVKLKITLAAARVNAGLSMKAAAEALGVSYPTLRQYELYKSPPTRTILDAMCKLYGMPLENIVVLEIKPDKVPRSKCRLYRIWSGMKQRCNNPNCNRYRHYGALGIKVCKDWESSYDAFSQWSLENGYTDELTLDRIDSAQGYCPENCRWIPAGLNASLAQSKKYGRTEAWSFEHWDDHH